MFEKRTAGAVASVRCAVRHPKSLVRMLWPGTLMQTVEWEQSVDMASCSHMPMGRMPPIAGPFQQQSGQHSRLSTDHSVDKSWQEQASLWAILCVSRLQATRRATSGCGT